MSNDNSPKSVLINISTSAFIKFILLTLLVFLLYFFRDLVLIILTAIVIASSIEPLAKWLMRHKIPRVPAVIFVYLGITGIFVGIFMMFMPLILGEISNLSETIPQYIDSVELWSPASGSGFLPEKAVEGLAADFSLNKIVSELQSVLGYTFSSFWQTVSHVFGGLLSFVLIIVFSFYFAVQEYGIVNFLKIITPLKHEEYVIGLWKRSQSKIGRWAQGQLLLALFIGILVYLGLMILGVKYALLLALLAAVAELIPLFGPVLAAIPAILIGFMDGGTSLGLMVVGLYVIIQQFENHLIYPLVVKKVVGVPPLMVIVALLVGAKLAGFLGIIIAVPIAATLMEFVNDLENKKRGLVKNGMSDPQTRNKK